MACRYTYKGKTYEAHEFDDVLRAMSPMEARQFMPRVEALPSAPFVGKTEAWVGLALKRMIRYGAENGFDKISWTNGAQQVDRYDLSKQIKQLDYERIGGPGEAQYVLTATTPDGRKVDLGAQTEKTLPDAVGKDLAAKIIGNPDKAHRYHGLDLKVGGEGMRAFYDKIVPNVANDILKKLGGGRVGVVELGDRSRIRAVAKGVLIGKRPDDHTEQPGFDITPEMREAAGRGLPMFSRQADAIGEYVLERGTDKRGQPAFANQHILIANGVPDPVSRGEGVHSYTWKVYDRTQPGEKGAKFLKVGELYADLGPDGKFEALRGITIYSRYRQRGLGYGESVVASMLASNGRGHPMAIVNIVHHTAEARDDALPFWRKLGVQMKNYATDPNVQIDGDLTLTDYLRARGERSRFSRDAIADRRGTRSAAAPSATAGAAARQARAIGDDGALEPGADAGRAGGRQGVLGREPGAVQGDRAEVARRVAIRSAMEAVVARWGNAPPIKYHDSINSDSVPLRLREENNLRLSRGATGAPEAAWDRGTIHVFLDAVSSPERGVVAVIHEGPGHFGLRGTFGDRLNAILDDVAKSMPDRVKAKARQYGFDFDNVDERRQASEEVLAEMAQSTPHAGIVRRAIAAIRQFLREIGVRLDLSDNDIITNFIMPAREFVERGRAEQREAALAFSRVGLKVALRLENGEVVSAEGVEATHGQIYDRVVAEGKIADAPLNVQHAIEVEPGFVDRDGKFLTRDEAYEAVGVYGSEDLDEPQEARFSRAGALDADAREEITNLFTSQRTFNRWWHRTVGTQFHKAKKDRDFKRVFDLGQDYLTDTSRYAMLAEKDAPNLLLRMEGVSEILKRGISKKDREALATPIFDGTLEEQTFTDDELRERFGLNERQAGYYREFRAAVDRSLDELAKSTMGKMAKGIGIRMDAVMDLRDLSLDRFHAELIGLMRERVRALDQLTEDTAEPGAKALAEERADSAKKQVTATVKLFNRVEQLKGQGYAPLMRFGEYTVYVTEQGDGGTEQVFFGLYETQREANAAAKALAEEYHDAQVEQGILSKEAWRVFQGLSPDTVEVFAKAAGLDQEPLFQEYLRLAVNNRSALKRLMHRKGVPGFSQDVTRVLASFVTSNARLTSSNYHLGQMQAAVEAIPKAKGDVRDEAVRLWKYLTDPQEEAGALRGFLFFQFLGGSIASAMVNATQPVTMTAPYLTKYANPVTVAAELGKAAMEAARNKPGADVRGAYERAVGEGIVAPHEIYQLMAQARGNVMGASGMGRAMKVWGSFFSLAEAFNRRATFIAAYRIAQKNGVENPYAFAKEAVHDTQGLYNKGNRPNWARGPVGATVFTFKQFSIAYVEFLKRLHDSNQPAFWMALAVLMLAAGLEGMPFAEDIEDIIDTIGQWLGYSTNSKRWLRDRAAEALGEGGAAFVLHGFSAIPGVPLDVSLRMGLANLIPGTALFKRSEAGDAKAREALEVAGPIGGVVQQIGRGLEAAASGDAVKAARSVMPLALANLFKGAEMWEKGYYTDTRGRRVMDTTEGEAILKSAGFQPASVAKESRNIQIVRQDIELHRTTEAGIADKWARGIVEQDDVAVNKALRELDRWNENNPDTPIRITRQQIRQRVLAMRRTRAERFTKSAPPEMRGRVVGEISR